MPETVPSVDYEMQVWSALIEGLRDGLAGETVLLANYQYPGVRMPADGAEEWVSFWPLKAMPLDSGRSGYLWVFLFQVTCGSLLAEWRADKSARRPFQVAAKVRNIFATKSFNVRDRDADGASTKTLGVVSVGRPEEQYLSARSRTASGLPNTLGVGLPTNNHSVALTFRAVTDAHP